MPPAVSPPQDALDADARARERARGAPDRHGIVSRGLLTRELPPLLWGALFRALRLLELSGEAIGGMFFDGVPGLQFVSPAAFRILRDGGWRERAFWINAADPASPAGVPLAAGGSPGRVASPRR